MMRAVMTCVLGGLLVLALRGGSAGLAQPPAVAPLRTPAQLAREARALCLRARAAPKPVLVTLGADWCPDCRRMLSLSRQPPLADALRRYERLDLNVGEFDRHRDLIDGWGIHAISAWVIVTPPASCDTPLVDWPRGAQRTLEPLTGAEVDPAELAAWLARYAGPTPAPPGP